MHWEKIFFGVNKGGWRLKALCRLEDGVTAGGAGGFLRSL